jgi:CRP/FNR family transcriptional regulator, cyclic AMP receptor protein
MLAITEGSVSRLDGTPWQSRRSQAERPSSTKFLIVDHHFLIREALCAVLKTLKSNATILEAVDCRHAGTSLFAVCSGTVKISAPSPAGRGAIFNLMSDGAIFGEIALLDGLPRTADAMAITDCELMVIERRDFVPLLREQPEIAIKLIEMLCGRLRQTTEQVEDVMFLDLRGRLAKTLLRLAKNSKLTSRGLRVAMTQSDIGEIIGMSRESTNKQLRVWQDRKWLMLERGGIVILAPDALEEIASTADDE